MTILDGAGERKLRSWDPCEGLLPLWVLGLILLSGLLELGGPTQDRYLSAVV